MAKENFFKKHPLATTLIMMLLASIAIVLVVYFIQRLYSRHGSEYDMPELVGKNIDDLSGVEGVENVELVVVDSIFVGNTPGGNILTQDPKATSKIKKGRKVYVTVTKYNPDPTKVPNLTGGLSLKQAISQLESAGLECGYITFEENELGNNIVVRQMHKGRDVRSGTSLEKGSRIDLTVGCALNAKTTIPLVIGKTPREARKMLQMASLNVGVEHYEHPDDKNNSRVYDMQPNKTARVPFGTVIELWYRSESSTDFNKVVKNYKRDETPEPEEEPAPEHSEPASSSDDDFEW